MSMYHLRKRTLKATGDIKNGFLPNIVELEICLEPSETFGVGNKPTKNIVFYPNQINKNDMVVDQFAGKCKVIPDPLFDPIEIDGFRDDGLQIEMHGNILHAKRYCVNENDLNDFLNMLYFTLPMLLAVELLEAPFVKSIKGRIDNAPFEWSLVDIPAGFKSTTKEKQEQLIVNSLKRLNFICETDNKRLTVALSYYYTAKRLIDAGNSSFEFTAEAVLNYSKMLEIMFVRSEDTMNDVRNELIKFGYSKDEIEMNFIPIMVLRNYFDIGHVTIETFKQHQLDVLHEYLDSIGDDFTELLKKVIHKVQDGSYNLRRDSDLKPNNGKQKKFDGLVRMCKKKILAKKQK